MNAQLLPRNIEYLRLLGRGLKNRAIADAMGIELSAVRWHRVRVTARLASVTGKQCWTREDLAAWIAQNDPGDA